MMNINLHNYEEYFILYMDNELSSEDRRQVEEFVQKNPDLKEDLDILLQYKLVPDTHIVFAGKEELMKHGDLSPDRYRASFEANYQEWLILYMDNELTTEQRTDVEQFMAGHPTAKEELAILLRTQLQPEEISFPHKELLYRKEKNSDRDRVIPIRWWRIAAAAVLFLTIGLTLAIVLNKKSSGDKNEMVKVPVNNQKINPENTVVTKKEEPKQLPLPVISDNVKTAIASAPGQSNNRSVIKHRNVAVNEKKLSNKSTDLKDSKEAPVMAENNPKASNNLPQPLDPSSEIADANTINSKGQIREETLTSTVPVTPTATQTSYIQTDPSVNEGLNQSGGKKSKLRGFFRKLTRTFEKTTKMDATDEDRVLIGGLAFKLK